MCQWLGSEFVQIIACCLYASLNWVVIGSDNGLLPVRPQAIIWTNAGILLIGPLGTNFSEILIGIQTFSIKKLYLKTSSAKWHLFCLGLNELKSECCKFTIGMSTAVMYYNKPMCWRCGLCSLWKMISLQSRDCHIWYRIKTKGSEKRVIYINHKHVDWKKNASLPPSSLYLYRWRRGWCVC